MAFNISYVYEIINKASRPLKKIAAAQKSVARGAEVAASKAKRFGSALGRLRDKAKGASKKLRDLGGAMTLKVTAPLALLAGLALRSSANLETLQTAFESMLGSADEARKIMKKLIDFTARTPFQLEGVGRSAKQLLAFGVTTEELLPTLGFLGDIAAGSGASISEMAAIFGKVKAKGKAFTEELLQLSDRGIPIIDVLAKRFGVTKEAIFDAASKGKISFEIIEDAMQRMAQKGGIFFKQMERQSATLAGKFSTLKDNVSLAMAKIGDVLVESLDLKSFMDDVITRIQSATKAFAEFAKNNPQLTKFGLIMIGIVAVLGPVLIFIGALVAAFVFLSAPVLVIIAAFAVLSVAVSAFLAFQDEIMMFFSSIGSAVDVMARQFMEKLGKSPFAEMFTRGLERISDFFSPIVNNFVAGMAIIENATVALKNIISPIFSEISNIAVGIVQPIIDLWDSLFDSISSVSGVIQSAQQFFGFGDDRTNKIRSPGAQELNGRLGIDINLAGNTSAVESASARPIGRGNLGMNMAFAQ